MEMPTIDVNLDARHGGCSTGRHDSKECEPVLIPCPIPRSVTFTVRLGECACSPGIIGRECGAYCPARPIRVSCSISGKTWEESEVTKVDPSKGPDGFRIQFRETEALAACRARWEIVKALILNTNHAGVVPDLAVQRDAVFAALAAKVRAEQDDDSTTSALVRLVPGLKAHDVSATTAMDYLSARALERYVESLIEQVGGMT